MIVTMTLSILRTLCAAGIVLASLIWASGSMGGPAPLRVGTKDAPPFAIPDAERPSGTTAAVQWAGLSIELWERIAEELGVEFEYYEHPLDELFSELQAGELDVVVAAITITAERERLVDFSHSYFQTSFGVAVPVRPEGGALALLSALWSPAFLGAIGVLLLILLIVGVLAWLAERGANAEQFGGSSLQGIGNGFWWSAVTMTTVGYGDKAPRSVPGRILGVVWMFTSVIIIASVTGAIASAFTVQHLQSDIETFDDVVRARTGTVKSSASERYLRDAGARPAAYADLTGALAALAEREIVAVVHDAPILKYRIAADHAGEMTLLPLEFREADYAIALPEESPLREPVNRALLAITASSEWDDIQRRYLGD
jgi:ABC-type amino acid transport substrate-binding protein